MSNQTNGSPSFDEVQEPTVRAWNRLSTFFNVTGDFSLERGLAYLSRFSFEDRQQIQSIFDSIKSEGYEATKRRVMRDFQLGEEAQQEQA